MGVYKNPAFCAQNACFLPAKCLLFARKKQAFSFYYVLM
jgi:hypothetical protein